MMNSIAASLALFAAGAIAQSVGQAQVLNKCSYDVYLHNVPASGGGYSEQDQTLASGDSWSQTYTELSNLQGWSIKLSNSTSLDNILQYEYTFHNDGIIWFDLSCINGDPWAQNWEITADNGCTPKQTAYYYPTDDDYGMQSCDSDASVLVTLCAFEGGSASGSSSVSASAPAYTSAPLATSTTSTTSSVSSAPAYTSSSSSEEAPVTTTSSSSPSSSTSSTQHHHWYTNDNKGVVAEAATSATPTTLATVVSQEADGADVTVVEVVTAVETAVVTAYGRHRRHEHHPGHQHHA